MKSSATSPLTMSPELSKPIPAPHAPRFTTLFAPSLTSSLYHTQFIQQQDVAARQSASPPPSAGGRPTCEQQTDAHDGGGLHVVGDPRHSPLHEECQRKHAHDNPGDENAPQRLLPRAARAAPRKCQQPLASARASPNRGRSAASIGGGFTWLSSCDRLRRTRQRIAPVLCDYMSEPFARTSPYVKYALRPKPGAMTCPNAPRAQNTSSEISAATSRAFDRET